MPSSSASSNSTEVITNVVFGLTATAISIVTVYQGHRVWKMWREHGQGQENVAAGADPSAHSQQSPFFTYNRRVDVELGLHSLASTPTGLGSPRTEEVVAASAPSSEHVEDVTVPAHLPAHLPVSVSDSQLQSTLPTAVDVGPSSNPSLVQGAQTADDVHPGVHTGNAQPVMTDSERLELPSCRQR